MLLIWKCKFFFPLQFIVLLWGLVSLGLQDGNYRILDWWELVHFYYALWLLFGNGTAWERFWVSLIGRFRDGIGLQIHHLNATVHRGITCPFDRKSYRTWMYISSGHDVLIIPDYYSIGITVWEYVTLIIHPVNQTWLLRNPKTVSCVSCKEKGEDVKKGIKVDEWYLQYMIPLCVIMDSMVGMIVKLDRIWYVVSNWSGVNDCMECNKMVSSICVSS